MDKPAVSGTGRRSWVIVIAAALIAAGCGSTVTPSPTTVASASATPAATASPSPTPSPTPDLSAATLADLTQLSTTGTVADVTGTLTSSAGTWPVNGTMTIAGQDEQTDVTVTEGTAKVETKTVVSSGKPYVAHGAGPFFAGPALSGGLGPTSGATLGPVLGSIKSVQDMGVETHAGQQLHHVKPTMTVTPLPFAVGLTDATIKGAALTTDIYTNDAGAPIVLSIAGTWQQTVGRSTVAMTGTFDIALGSGFASVTIPNDVWTTFSSKRFLYHAAKGTDWTLSTKSKDFDELATPEDAFIDIASVASHVTLTALTNDAISVDSQSLSGKKPEKNESIKVGGVPARMLTFHGTYKKTKIYLLDVSVVYGGRAFDINYTTLPGTEALDRTTFLEFLGTFAFGR